MQFLVTTRSKLSMNLLGNRKVSMKRKNIKALERALKISSKLKEVLSDLDDDIFFEEKKQISRNMSVQDCVGLAYREADHVAGILSSTFRVLQEEELCS